jgi:ATP-dependent Lhr-like helicase
VAAAELGKERARLVLSRYGVVSRELLEAELPPLRWSALFESFRLLELAGEALGGRFIEGLSGPQFADPQALPLLERLGELRAEEPLYWMSARDPASPCGRARELQLPSRIASNHLVFAGTTLVLASSRSGQELRIPVGADHRRLPAAVELHCTMLLRREVAPLTRLRVETINGTGAARSPFASLLLQHGFTAERSALVRWAGYR